MAKKTLKNWQLTFFKIAIIFAISDSLVNYLSVKIMELR